MRERWWLTFKQSFTKQKDFEAHAMQSNLLLSQFTVALYTIVNNTVADQCSGTILYINGRILIATCSHFLYDNRNADINILCHGNYDINKYINRIVYSTKCGVADPIHNDFGYLELSDRAGEYIQPIDSTRFENNIYKTYNDLLIQSGFPADKVTRQPFSVHSFKPVFVLTESERRTDAVISKRFQHGRHLISDYPTDICAILPDGEVDLPGLPGMSGGGLWTTSYSEKQETLWTPSIIKFAGVNVEFEEGVPTKPVLGVSIKDVIQFERKTSPEVVGDREVIRMENGRKAMIRVLDQKRTDRKQ